MRLAGLLCRVLGIWHHEPVRQPLGGVRCALCGKAGVSEAELLRLDEYVNVERPVFTRDPAYPLVRRAW